MQITISNAKLTSEDGTVISGTLTGDATLTPPVTPPGTEEPVDPWYGIDEDTGWLRPSHPILLPPTSDNPDVFFVLTFCPNPPPPHWEWIAFSPGSPPARPRPEPPPTEPPTTPGGIKPPPPNGGWGYWPGYGWVYYPGPSQPGPKRR
jgi:hypothetical protein